MLIWIDVIGHLVFMTKFSGFASNMWWYIQPTIYMTPQTQSNGIDVYII